MSVMAAKEGVNPKDLLGTLKPPLELVPAVGIIWTAMAMKFGAHGVDAEGAQVRAKGYGPYNWRTKPVKASVYVAAIARHMARVQDGGAFVKADDSKVPDLAHVAACCFILLDAQATGNLVDDLASVGGVAGALIDALTIKQPANPPRNPYAQAPTDSAEPEGFTRIRDPFSQILAVIRDGRDISHDDIGRDDEFSEAVDRVRRNDLYSGLGIDAYKTRTRKSRASKPRRRKARK